MSVCKAFKTVKGAANYMEHLDINIDSAIKMEDIMIVIKHFNKVSSDY